MRPSHLMRIIFSYPPTWLAVAIIGALEWAIFDWFRPPFLIAAVMLGIGFALLLMWPVLLVKSKSFGELYFRVSTEVTKEDLQELERLAADLETLGSAQGVEQLRKLREQLDDLTTVLKHRLNAGELTYGRYLTTAEHVYLSAVDNLRDVVVAMRSVSAIEPEYIDQRLRELRKIRDPSDEQEREVASVEQRGALRDQQMRKAGDLLAQNELAMTGLVNTAAALADTKTGKDRALIDAQAAMAELEMLAKRAGKYATTAR